ncbi:A-kinase anchoring 7 isoform X2 [Pelobates cultripes]|uniref:A-kinase anchoring 7 isoform X2 n=1 Tax=Pelobates cultripes TaxID=61616 RepID=A0AAD1RE65_PELCU|nr:A-kinase anchoring 7 isoform X2 [Pelobates cultripes]
MIGIIRARWASVFTVTFRGTASRALRDVDRQTTPIAWLRARLPATSMEHGTPLSEPPLEALTVTGGVGTSAQQEETEKPLNTEEDTQKKKRFRRRYRKPKSQVQESKPKHSFLAELPFANVDIGAAFEIPKTLEKKGKNKRKINHLSENKEDDMSKKKKTANYFVSVPISNPKILGDIQTFQDAVLEKDERLTRAMIPKGSFHITLFVMHLSNEDEVNLAMSALLESKKPIENVLEGKEVVLTFHGVDEFKHEVVYGKIREGESVDTLTKIAEIMVKIFQEKGIITVGYKGFVPHLTFLKLSRAPKLRKQGIKKIDPRLYNDFQDHYFGDDTLFRIDLCSMLKKRQSGGYYHTEASIYIGQKNGREPDEAELMSLSKRLVENAVLKAVQQYIEETQTKTKQTDGISIETANNEKK